MPLIHCNYVDTNKSGLPLCMCAFLVTGQKSSQEVFCIRRAGACVSACACMPRSLGANAWHGMRCHRASVLCVVLTLSACPCASVCRCTVMGQRRLLVDSSIIFPLACGALSCAVMVTLGSFWTRKMVHPSSASPHISCPL